MTAVRFHQTGGADVLRLEQVEVPVPGPGQVRLRVAASAFNPADGGMRGGFLPIPVALPHVPGYDASGTVDALGDGVAAATGLAVGDAVVAFLPMTADGAAAQYVVAPADALVAAPTSIPLADAAGLPSVALTAHQALFELGRLTSGQRVAVNGAGGPVGLHAVRLARRAGARVVATASPRSRAAVLAAGADEVVDHTTTPLLQALTEPVDVLLNLAPVTEADFAALATRVRDGGVVVSTTPVVATPDDPARGVRGATVYVHPDAEVLAELVGLVDSGELRVDVAERVPLAELADLHARSDAGRVHGKVVVVLPAL
ncbi:NADP-dependent oxidoreductase [Quadrisphaera sp. INWT6]|uniref:NADP-dependent oxidoreductase n=1 Tax=Quadrisphaera sp. INWT6 TaxID=2596917 RepID=UPI001892237B|nr:NADP-dependent oxidoreductase [Quadrisphaera sp. INWT6]MBF5082641.1 NADP-dependent oxidoreductase [Quadrisphaera sp. INWT6]